MDERDRLAERFEGHRPHLTAVAYRMLGSLSEAEDAVQETWLRTQRSGVDGVENLGGWLTTVVGRICLDQLRTRKTLREDSLETHVPEPVLSRADGIDPEQEAVLADSVGLALLVVLDTLAPAERLAFVLHDMFAVPFDDIAPIVDRTPASARQLASRARRRVQGAAPAPDTDLARQRKVVDAFLSASRQGDFDALLAVLDPDVVLRADSGEAMPSLSKLVRGARSVVAQALTFSKAALLARPALVNGAPGLVTVQEGQLLSVMAFTVVGGKVVEINILADPARLKRLDVSRLGD
ncbi:RNA polymerase sigma factor SigJ [Streptomyces sp. NPDC048248]|uniref:RNA polymerase sigma factor SigJ n=1 Tax=Streptomyces sp. NPDC048248 TaxID=3365523 RepID=UPI003711C6DD